MKRGMGLQKYISAGCEVAKLASLCASENNNWLTLSTNATLPTKPKSQIQKDLRSTAGTASLYFIDK